jgi:hypothetical protein
MNKILQKLLCAVRALRLARCQQATKTETLEHDPICLLAHREVNLIFVVQIQQLNAVLEKDTDICFTKTNDDED